MEWGEVRIASEGIGMRERDGVALAGESVCVVDAGMDEFSLRTRMRMRVSGLLFMS